VTSPSLAEMVTDGANRVGPRHPPPTAAAVLLLAVVVTATTLRSRRRGLVFSFVLVAALAAAIPGLRILATQRSDSPAQAGVAAATIERFRARVEGFARMHRCAQVVSSSCVECDPVVHFALADVKECATPASVVLRANSLTTGCHEEGNTLLCGEDLPR
jgi:hypothetical protein